MRGNFQVRFLGEGVAVMPPPYPTQTRRGARGNVRSDETLLWNPAQAGVIGTPWMLPQSRTLRSAVKQAYGVRSQCCR